MIDEIRKTDIWTKLITNPKFETEFTKALDSSLYQVDIDNLIFSIKDNKLVMYYTSNIQNRDLDCQRQVFEQKEFSIDDEGTLSIHELSGSLESNYGYDFNNTIGGIINTHYSTVGYDIDGVELNYQSYSDKYHLDDRQFKTFRNDLRSVVLNAYNPNLTSIEKNPHPHVIGRDGRFIKEIRSKESLGIVEVIRYIITPNANIGDYQDEFYFNTFLTNNRVSSPELIHIVNGFPFAKIDDNRTMKINKEYAKLGLNTRNYQEVARDRFLKELIEEKQKGQTNSELIRKYDLMIDRLKNEMNIKERTR